MGLVMNAMPLTAARPLLDLLGARWQVGAPAAAVAWDAATGLAGFALGDGTLALVHPAWEGASVLRPRNGGDGAELVPGTAPAPPAASRADDHLAIGTDGGQIAVQALPDMLFHDHPRQQ
jgi:hypothetical protein